MIIKRVKQHADIVVIKNIVTLGEICPHLSRVVIAMKGDVKKSRIVAEKNLGLLRRSDIVARRCLIEVLEPRGILPDGFIQFTVDHRRAIKSRHLNG